MSRINRIIIVFIVVITFFIGGVWQLIQTEKFARFVSSYVSSHVISKLDANVSFTDIEIEMFPPATILKGVHLDKKVDENKVAVEVDSLAIIFSFWDFFSNKINVDRLVVRGGVVKMDLPVLKQERAAPGQNLDLSSTKIKDVFKTYFQNVYSKIPIPLEYIEGYDVLLTINESSVWIHKVTVGLWEYMAMLELSVEHLKHEEYKLDSLTLRADLSEDKVSVNELVLRHEFEVLTAEGSLYDASELSYSGELTYRGPGRRGWKYLSKYLDDLKSIDGYFEVKAEANGPVKNPDAKVSVEIFDLKSNFANLLNLKLEGEKKGSLLSLNSMVGKDRFGTVSLGEKRTLFDFSKQELVLKELPLIVDGLHTNTALHYIKDVISPLKGQVKGEVSVILNNDNVIFSVVEGTVLSKFTLDFDTTDLVILQNEKVVLNKGEFQLNKDNSLHLDLALGFGDDSTIDAKGVIQQDYINIKANSDNFDFEKFGPISGAVIHGQGNISFTVDGPFEDVRFYFDLSMDNTKVIDLNLGHVNSKLRLDLKDLNLYLTGVKGTYNASQFDAVGRIRFEDIQDYEFKVSFPRATYKDTLEIYENYLGDPKLFPKGLSFSYSGQYFVSGTLKKSAPTISGNINAHNLHWFNEDVDRASASFIFDKNILDIQKVSLAKRGGKLNGYLTFDFDKEYVDYYGELKDLRLKDIAFYRLFNFGYDGKLGGIFKGDGKASSLITQTNLRVTKGNIFNKATKDSSLVVYSNSKDFYFTGNLLGDIFTLDSYVNFNTSDRKKKSYLNAAVNTNNVKILSGILSEHNSLDNKIKGRVSVNLSSSFTLADWRDLNLLFEVNEFVFKRGEFRLVANPLRNSVVIKNGEIEVWDLLLKGGKHHLSSMGRGKIYDDIKVENKLSLSTSLLEVIFPKVQKSLGDFTGRFVLVGENGKYKTHIDSEGKDLYLKLTGISDAFDNVEYSILSENNNLFIQKFDGHFGRGKVSADGNIVLDFPYPSINLNLEANQSQISFFSNSNVVVSGKVNLSGNKTPYKLSGDAVILYGELFDEFSEYSVGSGEEVVDNRFIPKTINVNDLDFFVYDLRVDLLNPLLIKNSLADLRIGGYANITGSYLRPAFNGELYTIAGESRVLLKGHEFFLTEGRVSFNDVIGHTTPDIRVSANSTVSNYNIKVDVSGKVDKFDTKFSSDPTLSQEDILSLLTLGITSDISKNLEEGDRKSITSVGIGSLIVDQFKLNSGLNSSLGLKVSVLPEFGESNESLLHGRSSTSSSTTKFKSSTKVKLQTKVHEKVDVSVSSTLGGSLGQKQEMNINYNINNNLSLLGVYETEESEAESADSSVSIGFDLKFKKTFK